MRWLDSITILMDMNLRKLQVTVEDKGARCAIVHWITKSQTPLRNWRTITTQSNTLCLLSKIKKEFLQLKNKKTNNPIKNVKKIWVDKECIHKASMYMKTCSTLFSSVQFSRSVVSDTLWPHESQHTRPPCPLLVIRKTHIKSIMKYHLTLIRMAAVKQTNKTKLNIHNGEFGILVNGWWEWKVVLPLWKTIWQYLKLWSLKLPNELAPPLWVCFPQVLKQVLKQILAHKCS